MKWQLMMWISLILFVLSCNAQEKKPTVEELIEILETPEAEEFSEAIAELSKMEASQIATASLILAKAMQYPRHDSYAATALLIELGPEAKEAIPELVKALNNQRSEVRAEAAIILGVMGEVAQCTTPQLAQLLWDDAPEVRGSAARAMDAITGTDLVEGIYKLNIRTSIIYDDKDNSLSKKAQDWWTSNGRYEDWFQKESYCQY